jgi:uncharacterized membrane protein HdeD (DUF308 family)
MSAAVAAGGRGWSIVLGILLIVAGLLAVAAPEFGGIVVSIVLGWVIIFAGFMHLLYAWSERGAGAVVWQVLIGIVYLVAGFYMLRHPTSALVSLTLVLGLYIALEGFLELGAYLRLRKARRATWFLVDGIISLILAALILCHWPLSATWAIGTLVGISLLFSGIARLTWPMSGRGAIPAVV